MNRRQKRRQGRRHPSRYTAAELREMILADAENHLGPASTPNPGDGLDYLLWFIQACDRIAKAEHRKVDDVFSELEGEVRAKTGHGMPL